MDNQLEEFRRTLLDARQQAQNNYDKHLISLSGGALGVSIAFINNIIGNNPIHYQNCLLWAWILWIVSIVTILVSFFSSHRAIEKAIRQVDNREVYEKHLGGGWDKVTSTLNIISGVAFLLGMLLIIFFIYHNLGGSYVQ